MSSYESRIFEILSSPQCTGLEENITLKFDEPARIELARYANFIESNVGPIGYYSDIKDAASKIAENAARLAALFHIYEGYSGPVSNNTLQRAVVICDWHLSEFKALFGTGHDVVSLYDDANEIERYVSTFYLNNGPLEKCAKVRLSQSLRGSLKHDAVRRESALNHLLQCGRIYLYFVPGSTTQYIALPNQPQGMSQQWIQSV